MSQWRKKMGDGPVFRFVYLWSGLYPHTYDLDLSGSGCVQTINWDRIATVHTLDRGDYKRYLKGFQLKATLFWGREALVPATQWDTDSYYGQTEKLVNLMFSTTCEEQILYWPYPEKHPSTYFNVIWSGNYNFNYVSGLVGEGFQGRIQLTGKDILERPKTFYT